jgi:hypothetical protein
MPALRCMDGLPSVHEQRRQNKSFVLCPNPSYADMSNKECNNYHSCSKYAEYIFLSDFRNPGKECFNGTMQPPRT